MGTWMAPSFANLLMEKLEHKFLLTQDVRPQERRRFVDDIFAIWTNDELSLNTLIDSLNHHQPTTKCTSTWSAKQVTFLDTTAYLENRQIRTSLHV